MTSSAHPIVLARRVRRTAPLLAAVGVVGVLVLSSCQSTDRSASVVSANTVTSSRRGLTIPSATGTTTVGATTSSVVPTTRPAPTTTRTSVATTVVPAPTTTRPTVAGATVVPTAAPAPGIVGVDFDTFAYDLGDAGVLNVVRGAAQRGNIGDADYVFVRVQDVRKGDIDGDGQPEAVVTLLYNTGGTGQFTDVFVYRWNGTAPVLVTRAGVGDRAFDGVRTTTLQNGKLVIDRFANADGACCPTAVTRQTFTLGADSLQPSGASRTWALVYLDRDPAAAGDEPVRFLPGTNGAFLSGLADQSRAGGFAARKGQKVTLTIDELDPDGRYAPLDLVHGGVVLGTAAVGTPLQVTLPATGDYLVRVHADGTPGALPASVEAELVIT